MDPFSKRLRKQRERNSLQARQLNKNASSMLQRQIKVLDRRQQLNSHALRRDKEQLLRELAEFQHTEHNGLLEREEGGSSCESSSKNGSHGGVDEDISYLVLNTAANTEHASFNRRYVLPALWETWKPGLVLGDKKEPKHGAGAESGSPSARGRGKVEFTNNRGVGRLKKVLSTTGRTESNEGKLSLDAEWLAIWGAGCSPSSESDSKTYHKHHDDCESADGETSCRYSTLSHMRPCSYFPCSTPSSYHHLVVSEVRYSVPLHLTNREFTALSQIGARNTSYSVFSDSFQSMDSQASTSFSVSRRNVQSTFSSSNKTEVTSEASSRAVSATSKSRRAEGHISPRTSIGERLRGLRQLVQELRLKNEAKRPRAWAVNYGDAVSRRLIRKPIAVGAEK